MIYDLNIHRRFAIDPYLIFSIQFLSLFNKHFVCIFSFLFQFFNWMYYTILENSPRVDIRSDTYKVQENCFNMSDFNLLFLIKFCINRHSFVLICFQQNFIKFASQYLWITFLLLLLGKISMHWQTLYQDWNGELIF